MQFCEGLVFVLIPPCWENFSTFQYFLKTVTWLINILFMHFPFFNPPWKERCVGILSLSHSVVPSPAREIAEHPFRDSSQQQHGAKALLFSARWDGIYTGAELNWQISVPGPMGCQICTWNGVEYSFKDISSSFLKLLIVWCGLGPQPAAHEQLRKQGSEQGALAAFVLILHKTLCDSSHLK